MIPSRNFINANSFPSSSREVKTLLEFSPWDPELEEAHLPPELTCDPALAGLQGPWAPLFHFSLHR